MRGLNKAQIIDSLPTDDPLKNPDRDDEHRRRREAGNTDDTPDGREVARMLYGGVSDSENDDD